MASGGQLAKCSSQERLGEPTYTAPVETFSNQTQEGHGEPTVTAPVGTFLTKMIDWVTSGTQENAKFKQEIAKLKQELDAAKAGLTGPEVARLKQEIAKLKQENAAKAGLTGPEYEGCTRVGAGAVNTTGFSIINKHNLAVMGDDINSRTCVLRGVVKFTSDGNTATAWLDPNYRDPDTGMPLCFPASGTMQFFASIVNPKDTSEIERTVGLQIEPHGR